MSSQGPDLVSFHLEGPYAVGPLANFDIIDATFETIAERVLAELFRIFRQLSNNTGGGILGFFDANPTHRAFVV